MATGYRIRSVLITALVAVPVGLGACGDGGDGVTISPSPERSPEITDIADDYFGNADFIGRTVTVAGEVTRVITSRSFVLTGDEYGDGSLLVLNAAGMDVEVGETVEVTGNVQKFGYQTYRDEYRLDEDPRTYAEFNGEEFLVAMGADASPGPSPSAG